MEEIKHMKGGKQIVNNYRPVSTANLQKNN